MKNLTSLIGKMACLALALFAVVACSDDETPSYSSTTLSADSELKAILVELGYTFNEDGNLLLDDLANSTTSLDLSGTNISQSALAELSILPNLTEVNLANNGYGPVFYVDSLPSQITGLDLRGNEIYDFEGLVDASVVNDEVIATVLHSFDKLYLPASCKYNVEDLMPFYTQNQTDGKTVDMQMVDDNGALSAYNTLREMPDQYFRSFMKNLYPSVFTADNKIDISKPLSVMERGVSLQLWFPYQYEDLEKIESLEGLEYFINNPYYPSFYVSFGYDEAERNFSLSYLMPRENIKGLHLKQVDTPQGMDLSKATNLASVIITGNKSIKTLDLSHTLIANQEAKDVDVTLGNLLDCNNCESLQEIKLPLPNKGIIERIELMNLPSLKELDLSSIYAFHDMALISLEVCDVIYPNATHYYSKFTDYPTIELLTERSDNYDLSVSEDVFNKESTKSFITKYREYISDSWISYRKKGAYRWSKYM